MKQIILLLVCIYLADQATYAQPLATITGKRMYEHHSPSIAGISGANGSQSGYNFLNHTYVYSFDTNTFGSYTDGTDTSIDMVEHNGPYGNGGALGFTSGLSSIWQGDIKGNGITKWIEAPGSFNYMSITSVSEIKDAYNATMATQDINVTENNKVYLGRIRNSGLYVAMRCYNVTNGGGGNDNYFNFDYKYGIYPTTAAHVEERTVLSIYPNPAMDAINIRNTLMQALQVKIVSATGKEMQSLYVAENAVKKLDISNLANGLYLIICLAEDGTRYIDKFMKH